MTPALILREQSFCVGTMGCMQDRMFVVEGVSIDAIVKLQCSFEFHALSKR